MPDSSSLLSALYVVGLSTFIGVAYALLIQGGEILAFIPIKVSDLTKQYHKGTGQLMTRTGTRRLALKLFTCGKCIAGQTALWYSLLFLPLQLTGVGILLLIGTVCASIVLASSILLYAGTTT